MKHLIVSRHPAAIAFVRESLPAFADAPVVASATPADVRGSAVAGNLPLHLAAVAAEVYAVEFAGDAPRGAEYGLEEMRAAGARIARYTVTALPPPPAPDAAPVEFTYSDKRLSRGRSADLLVGRGDALHKFLGQAIPGVVAVVSDRYQQNGKWSGSDWTLRRPANGWHLVLTQDFETSQFWPNAGVADIIRTLRAAGCTAPEDAIIAFLEPRYPKTLARARERDAQLEGLNA